MLVAPPDEVDHFFRRAVVLVLSCDASDGARGLILEMATAFTLGDMAPDIVTGTPFEESLVFRGGGGSAEGGALMLHNHAGLPALLGTRPPRDVSLEYI